MYTTQPCSVPSGTTVVPQALIAAAQAAATSAIQSGITSLPQVMQIVQNAIQTMIAKSPNVAVGPSGQPQPIDPNAATVAMNAGYSTALQTLQNNQVNKANTSWLRILQRSPQDFAGMRIPTSEFNVPQLDPELLTNPEGPGNGLSGPNSAACNPTAASAPNIIPINGGFGYVPAKATLTTAPQRSVPQISAQPYTTGQLPTTPSGPSTRALAPVPAYPANNPPPMNAAQVAGIPPNQSPKVYADWLNAYAPVDQQPLSCLMGGINCVPKSGMGYVRRGPFDHLRGRRV